MGEVDLRKILFSFEAREAPGVSGARISCLRRNLEHFKGLLLLVFNGIISIRQSPLDLITGVVRPPYKSDARYMVHNHRPISIHSCMALVLEKYVNVMYGFIKKYNILPCHKYGFVAGSGTQSLHAELFDRLNGAFQHGQFACALFLDVSKCF